MKRNVFLVAGIVLLGLSCASAGAATNSVSEEQKAIRRIDEQYVQAFNAKDAAAAAQFFTNDAVYNTDDGRTLNGRDEITRTLQEQFQTLGDATLELKVYGIEIAPDGQHAIERGVSVVSRGDINEPSSYRADFVKMGDQWRVSRVVEQPEAESTEHLQDLAWMIGNWTDQSEDMSVYAKAEWAMDHAFINRRFAVSAPDRRDLKVSEFIGWDPARQEIRSWYFDTDGGFGSGRWRKEGSRWIEEASGITPKGEAASATLIFTPKDMNSFTWSSTNRQVGGEKLEDVPEVTIVRK